MKAGTTGTPIGGPIKSFHTFQDMAFYDFPLANGTLVQTCPAALGYSFAAGTTDGPGIADFRQGLNTPMPNISVIWPILSGIVRSPSVAQWRCQRPKPVLLDIGEMSFPYKWGPKDLDIQLMRIGPIFIIVTPGEATTMSGRRWRNAIANATLNIGLLKDNPATANAEPIVLLGGPANTYGHYITTEEEYNVQRYEAASTLFGPHTLAGYIHLTTKNLKYLSAHNTDGILAGPSPPINVENGWTIIPAAAIDWTVWGRPFGSVVKSPGKTYKRGNKASVVFVAASPRNNFRLEGSYALVQRLRETKRRDVLQLETVMGGGQHGKRDEEGVAPPQQAPIRFEDSQEFKESRWIDAAAAGAITAFTDAASDGDWETVLSDFDWDLVMHWKRTSLLSNSLLGGPSEATLEWDIGQDVEAGQYRFVYNGDAKDAGGKITSFQGTSSVFRVVGP
jgi:neutral ceramidase